MPRPSLPLQITFWRKPKRRFFMGAWVRKGCTELQNRQKTGRLSLPSFYRKGAWSNEPEISLELGPGLRSLNCSGPQRRVVSPNINGKAECRPVLCPVLLQPLEVSLHITCIPAPLSPLLPALSPWCWGLGRRGMVMHTQEGRWRKQSKSYQL